MNEKTKSNLAGNEIQLLETNDSSKKRSYKGGSLLPNCRTFQIDLGDLDPRLTPLGIDRRIGNKIKIEPYNNYKVNRYIKFQLDRLEEAKSEPRKFFTIAMFLMKNSSAFQLSAFNKIYSGWYKNLPFWGVLMINRRIAKLLATEDDNLRYGRVYIPKGDTGRPLGVPAPEWRVITHMFNNFLKLFLEDKLLPSQHGYVSGRGTSTAGRDVLKLIHKRNIFECDLKQFFPSVNVNTISDTLIDLGMPKRGVYGMENLNRCNPELPEEMKLDESRYIMSEQDKKDISMGYFRPTSKLYDPIRDFIKHNGEEILYEVTGETNGFEIIQTQGALFDSYKGTSVNNQFEGVPQGLPTSPLLSILILKSFLSQVESVSYADDPIFFSDKEFVIRDDPDKGIVLNSSKSSGVKVDGRGLKPLKYLGLVYDPSTDTIKADTRKGSKLEMETGMAEHLIKAYSLKPINEKNQSDSKGSKVDGRTIFSSKVIGTIQSRLYSGQGSTELLEQDFRLKFTPSSFYGRRNTRYYDGALVTIFNASSFAAHSLLSILDQEKRKKLKRSPRTMVGLRVRKVYN